MKRKYRVIILIIGIFITLSIIFSKYCKMQYPTSYSVYDKTIGWINEDKHTSINVLYPQFIEINNVVVTDGVNQHIKEKALEQFSEILSNGTTLENTYLHINYEITYCNENLISIKFYGYVGDYETGSGLNKIYSTNIDLNREEEVQFESLFNESSNEMFTPYMFKNKDIIADDADFDYINEAFAGQIDKFEYFYFTQNEFCIILPIKDEYEFFAKYSDLDKYIDYDNKIWNNFNTKK